MERRSRSQATGGASGPRGPLPLPRTPDGTINNCALACGVREKDCQMCPGRCPDRKSMVGIRGVNPGLLNGPLTPEDRDTPGVMTLQEQADRDQAEYHERMEQRAGEEAFAAAAGDEGQRVEVSWGDELFQPVRFNGMRVGPFSATTLVRRGETIAQATVRLHREIARAAQQVFEEKSAAYLRNLAGMASSASKVEIPG